MSHYVLRPVAWGLAAAMLSCAGGCGLISARKTPPPARVFYPPPPDPPRLQFLLSFSNAGRWAEKRTSFQGFIVGEDTSAQGEIKSPYGLAARDGKLYICDVGLNRVHVIDLINRSYRVLGSPGQLKNPVNVAIAADGTKYVCDTRLGVLAVFDAQDQFVRFLGDRERSIPIDLAILGEELIVANVRDAQVEVWSRDGKILRVLATKGVKAGQLRSVVNVDVDRDGKIYVADNMASIIQIYDRNGEYFGPIGAPGDRPGFFARPKGLAFDPEGRLYVSDAQWEVIQLFGPDKRLLMYFGGYHPGPYGMSLPAGVAIDKMSIEAVRDLIDPDFQPEYVLFVANQFGRNKICVYAFGKSKTADYTPRKPKPTTQPSGTNVQKDRPPASAPSQTRPVPSAEDPR